MQKADQASLLTPTQAAELCGVDRTTMRRWLVSGEIPHSVTAGGWRRIARADLATFMRAHAIPVPPWLDPGPRRVLLVDDEPAVTDGLRRALLRIDGSLEIETATDGFSAGVLALSFDPHVMVLDLVMPGMDGLEVCRWAARQRCLASMAVVVLSGDMDDATERQLLALGVKACLPKPSSADLLYAAMRPWLPSLDRLQPESEAD